MRHLSLVLALGLLAGCQTYDSPFVHKSEAELDAMEYQNALAAESFQNQDYAQAEAILNQLAAEQTVSQPLYQLERVPVLLMQGKREEAHDLMMKTREQIETLFDPQSEERALSLWHGENNKVYKGEPHERATLYALLALSFMEKGAWEDALRCVKNGLLADSSTEGDGYTSDYGLLHYIGYVASRYAGDAAGAAEYQRELQEILRLRGVSDAERSEAAALFGETAELPNAFLIVWAGDAPSYGRGGEYEEVRYVLPGLNAYSKITLKLNEATPPLVLPQILGDVNFQATTRGGREMDHVLADKAALKKTMEVSKNIFFIIGTACFAAANGDAALPMICIGGGCYAAGVIPWIIGECINSKADIRYWHNLPGQFLVYPLVLKGGEPPAIVQGVHGWDVAASTSCAFPQTPSPFAVLHLQMAKTAAVPKEKYQRIYEKSCNLHLTTKDWWLATELPLVEEAP